ncbi:MAG: LPXTG cell wall anchor domain-containing protein [Ilumatobacteraceae bacterium]
MFGKSARQSSHLMTLGSLVALVAGGSMIAMSASAGAIDSNQLCSTEHYEFSNPIEMGSFAPVIDTGIVIAPPADGETLSIQVAYTAYNNYALDSEWTRAQSDQQHESFTVTVGGTQLGPLTPDLPDSVDEGAPDDYHSGTQTGTFAANDILGGPVVLVHSSQFGFTESPNSLEVPTVIVDVVRCLVPPQTTTTVAQTTTTVAETTTTVAETTTTVAETTTTVAQTTTTALPPGTDYPTTTTQPPVTTAPPTTVVVNPPTTAGPTTVPPTTVPPTTTTVPTLPATGQGDAWLAGVGGGSVLLGLAMLRLRSKLAPR